MQPTPLMTRSGRRAAAGAAPAAAAAAPAAPAAAPGPGRRRPRPAPRAAAGSSSASASARHEQPVLLDLAQLPQPVQALKEWAVICEALGRGEQTILLRKGGVREPTFKPAAQRFLLFPTAFHSDADLLQPGVAQRYEQALALDPRAVQELPLGVWAELTGAWTVRAGEPAALLAALQPLHVLGPGFLDARLKWRSSEPLTLLECRCSRLEKPVVLPVAQRPEVFGCFSWLKLDGRDTAPPGGGPWQATPALSDTQFAERQAVLRAALSGLGAAPLEP